MPGVAACCAERSVSWAAPIALYAGRIASGKGIDHLLAAARELTDMHLVLVGPDDRHGTIDQVRGGDDRPRPHARNATAEPPLHLYPDADVLCLPSAGESFGMAAAEAAAAGTPVVVTDRCGIAGFFREGEALVVPYSAAALTDALRRGHGRGAGAARSPPAAASLRRRNSWEHVGSPGGDLPRGDCFPAGFDEGFDRGVVAPAETRARESARSAVATRD